MIADAKTKVYGDADPALTYQVSGLKNGDTAGAVLNGGSLSRVAGENVDGSEKAFYRRADSRLPQAGGGRCAGEGTVSPTRLQ